jgi:hypothetical protein
MQVLKKKKEDKCWNDSIICFIINKTSNLSLYPFVLCNVDLGLQGSGQDFILFLQ